MILLVEAGEKNREILQKVLHEAHQSVAAVPDEAAAESISLQTDDLQLAVVDLAGLSPAVWNLCDLLKSRSVPIVVILPRDSREARVTAAAHGACAILVKPLVMRDFLSLVKALVRRP